MFLMKLYSGDDQTKMVTELIQKTFRTIFPGL